MTKLIKSRNKKSKEELRKQFIKKMNVLLVKMMFKEVV